METIKASAISIIACLVSLAIYRRKYFWGKGVKDWAKNTVILFFLVDYSMDN